MATFDLTKEYLESIQEALEKQDKVFLKTELEELFPADIAEILYELDGDEAHSIIQLLDTETGAEVLSNLDSDDRKKFIKDYFQVEEIAKFVNLFDSDDALIRIDMSEYMEKFAVSRLIGAPPGYVGYEEGGQLTEKVRRKPYSVVLLDEIEKAHPDVFNILLQLLDDGILTDSLGRKVDFKNTIVIMTSNIGSRQLKDFGTGVGFSTNAKQSVLDDHAKGVIEGALKKAFAPEFLNRIDDVVVFNSLTKEDIHKIIDIELSHLYKRVTEIGYSLKLSEEAKDFISDRGYDSSFGARPLKRAIQKYVEDPLAEEIIKSELNEGDIIEMVMNKEGDGLKIQVSKPGKSKKKTN